MKYYSEDMIRDTFSHEDCNFFFNRHKDYAINVRLCRECPYFEREHTTIETNGDFGYCTYKTDFCVMDDEPIHWYFTDINGFCREEDIYDE